LMSICPFFLPDLGSGLLCLFEIAKLVDFFVTP
jgi:hypothetical protein